MSPRLRARRSKSRSGGKSFPPVNAKNICDAHPRIGLGEPPFTGVQSNALYLQIFIADYTPGTQCPYNSETEYPVYCTGQQIAPSLVLTAEHCLSAAGVRADPDCANAEVTDIIGK